MFPFPFLSLPPAPLEIKKTNEQYYVKCLVRKKWLVLTPEEWVRQHVIVFLHQQMKIPMHFFSVEKTINYGKLKKRWDIMIYTKNYKPFLLIECKAPTIKLSDDTLFQLFTYQHVVGGCYLGISNGHEQFFYKIDNDSDKRIEEILSLPEWT